MIFNISTSEEPVIIPRPIPKRVDDSYVKNEILVGFKDNYSYEEIENYIDSLEDVNGYDKLSDKSYVIMFNHEFDTRQILNSYCNDLEKNSIVDYCEANNIIKLDDCSKGPC